ncbi:hypothetical protein Lser_V15G21946 [Lactuca serriola]
MRAERLVISLGISPVSLLEERSRLTTRPNVFWYSDCLPFHCSNALNTTLAVIISLL